MPARHTARRRMAGQRRKLVWAQSTGTVTFTAVNQYYDIDLLAAYKAQAGASSAGITVMRTIGWLAFQAPVAADSFYLGFRVDDIDQVVPAAAAVNPLVPNPRDNPFVNWMLSDRLLADANGNFGQAKSTYQGITFDLRSKRRMEEVQEAYLMTVVQDAVATPAKASTWFARVLIALP